MTASSRRRDEPIEDYLDELLSRLRVPPRATRRLLAETEDHLRQAAEAAEQAGASRVAAERQAVAQFGPAARVAAEASAARQPAPLAALGVLAWSGLALSGLGLVAVGLSGIVAAIFNAIAGQRFVGALPQTSAAAPCGHFLALHPVAHNCAQAAVLENSADAVALRLLAGVVGLVLVGLAWWARRYLSTDPSFRRLLSAALATAAFLSFGAATVVLLGMSLDTAVHYGSRGVGWYLSGGLVSLLGAVLAGLHAWRHLRVLRPWDHVVAPA
jgi:hypothetical protein